MSRLSSSELDRGSAARLRPLLAPESVAIVGVSAEDRGFGINGRTVLNHLIQHGFAGRIVPIHPRAAQIAGLPTAATLRDLKEPVDCALIAVPAGEVLAQLHDCVASNIPAAVVLTSQFAESGPTGAALQAELSAYAREHGLLLCGPNTTGLVSTATQCALSATASLRNRTLLKGPLALVTQSGAVGGALLDRAFDSGIGLSYLVGTGNEAVLDAADYVEFLLEEPSTGVVGLYLEALRNPERFLAVADQAARVGKPLVVFKVGRSEAGAQAALSHTGAIAGEYKAYASALQARGVVVADSLDDLVDTAHTLAQVPAPKGRRVGIFTFSGGIATALTDLMDETGLQFPAPSAATSAILAEHLGAAGSGHNPFDVTGRIYATPTTFQDCFRAFAADANYDLVILTLMPVASDRVSQIVNDVAEVARSLDKPVLVCWYAGSSTPGLEELRHENIPCFLSLERCIGAVRHLIRYGDFLRRGGDNSPSGKEDTGRMQVVRELLEGKQGALSEWDSMRLLSHYRIPAAKGLLVRSRSEAEAAAAELGLPVVLKVVSSTLTHKAAAGGVRTGLTDVALVGRAFGEVLDSVRRHAPTASIEGALVQSQVPADTEVMLGLRTDLDVGPVITFGPGGALADHLKDHAVAVLPRSEAEAEELLLRTRIGQALAARAEGWTEIRESLVRAVFGLSELAAEAGDLVRQVELNPLRVTLAGRVTAVDSLVILG